MTRNEVRNYIKVILRAHKGGDINGIKYVEKIIESVCDSWFFSWNNFFFGFTIGAITALVIYTIRL
jgi:hypothetical protein